MKNEVFRFVDIIENKSKLHSVDEIVGVCKRINAKRDFLFVNKYQGKHVPQKPSKIFELYDELIENINIADEKIAVVGFAETATAIGNYVAAKLPNCVYEMQTTRENLIDVELLADFKEEHSHATTQLLYGEREIFQKVDKILFVEDEITTGKTILNFIDELKKIKNNMKYAVVSILNWQDENRSKLYKELNIETYYLIKGRIKGLDSIVDVNIKDEVDIENKSGKKISCKHITSELCNKKATRAGRKPVKDLKLYSKNIYDKISSSSEILKNVIETEEKDILVIRNRGVYV